jgi:hypothetical protein
MINSDLEKSRSQMHQTNEMQEGKPNETEPNTERPPGDWQEIEDPRKHLDETPPIEFPTDPSEVNDDEDAEDPGTRYLA